MFKEDAAKRFPVFRILNKHKREEDTQMWKCRLQPPEYSSDVVTLHLSIGMSEEENRPDRKAVTGKRV